LLCEGIDEVEYADILFFAYEPGRCAVVRLALWEVMRGGKEARFGFEVDDASFGGVEE
jgi:hypothetical protein